MNSFFLVFSSKYKHTCLCFFKLFSAVTEWSSNSQWNLLLDNPKHMWRQPPLDLSKDSHTQQIEQPKTWLGFSLLYLGQNIKLYTSYRLRVELEILQKKQSVWLSIDRELDSIDRARQNCILNSVVNSIPTLHKRPILWASLNKTNICFDHGMPTLQNRVLIH